jgi:hypothetical protein
MNRGKRGTYPVLWKIGNYLLTNSLHLGLISFHQSSLIIDVLMIHEVLHTSEYGSLRALNKFWSTDKVKLRNLHLKTYMKKIQPCSQFPALHVQALANNKNVTLTIAFSHLLQRNVRAPVANMLAGYAVVAVPLYSATMIIFWITIIKSC